MRTKPDSIAALCSEELKNHPKLTANEVAANIGKLPGNVSGTLGALYYKGLADRVNVGKKDGAVLYAYTFNKKPKPARPKTIRHRTSKNNPKPTPEKLLPSVAEQALPAPASSIPVGNLADLFNTLASHIADQLLERVIANLEDRLAENLSRKIVLPRR